MRVRPVRGHLAPNYTISAPLRKSLYCDMLTIHYRSGYQYQLAAPYTVLIPIKPPDADIRTDYINLLAWKGAGQLTCIRSYAWDGPSGPAIHTDTFMRSSLVHDALYQLMRHDYLPSSYRQAADELLHSMNRFDGMWAVRAWWVHKAVRKFGNPAASPESRKPIRRAP